MTEFDLIKHYFSSRTAQRPEVTKGIGDDAAVIQVPSGHELVVTTDTLVADIHFGLLDKPEDIGYKSLAVNLSDLAAMGATPAWFTLAITLPDAIPAWIEKFSQGLFKLANQYNVQLIGGDVTRGPLSITIQAMGYAPTGKSILRSDAKIGDKIYVTGTIGDAGLGLRAKQEHFQLSPTFQAAALEKLFHPEPRITLGIKLRGIANSAIDISDGLVADLGHILEQSNVGAVVHLPKLPLSNAVAHSLPHDEAIMLALTAGDDYELCFTVPPNKETELKLALADQPIKYTWVGTVTREAGLVLQDEQGNIYYDAIQGYRHF